MIVLVPLLLRMSNDYNFTLKWCPPLWATIAKLNAINLPSEGYICVTLMEAYVCEVFEGDSFSPKANIVSVVFSSLTSLLHFVPL